MATPQEIAGWILDSFDPTKSTGIEAAIEQALCAHGSNPNEAALEAETKWRKVLEIMRAHPLEELPFDFSNADERRLIGKQRTRAQDPQPVQELRERLHLVPEMLQALLACSWRDFEKIGAALMRLNGAAEAFITGPTDDGGIDGYGRIQLRTDDPKMPQGLIHTNLLNQPYLFMGQSKHCAADARIVREELMTFNDAVVNCLLKYEGNPRPPSNRVPSSYYRRGEICIRIFFTTAGFSVGAVDFAKSTDIILVNGQQIAGFLVYHSVGVVFGADTQPRLDPVMFAQWVASLA